jgi:hypothetical protein
MEGIVHDPITLAEDRGAAPLGYQRRRPEGTVLYQVVQDHLATFLAQARERSQHGTGLPRSVESEFTAYLDCGIPDDATIWVGGKRS